MRVTVVLGVGLVSMALLSGCGLQLGGAVRGDPDRGDVRGAVEVGGRLHAVRGHGPYAGFGIVASPGEGRLPVRSMGGSTGYRLIASPALRFELGPELAVGEPSNANYQRTAMYLGAAGAVLGRLPLVCDQADNMVGVAPFGCAFDLVATVTAGRWARSAAGVGGGDWELGASLSLRITFFSDLLLAKHEGWESPWRTH